MATILRKAKTVFEELRDSKSSKHEDSFAPFANREEWELASFLMRSGLSQEQIDDYLTLPIVRYCFTSLSCARTAELGTNLPVSIPRLAIRHPRRIATNAAS